jgi:CO/xanthine dehydrogenase Mo-binding subunit
MPEAPSVEIELIDRPQERSLGAGEAAQGPAAAAIANAFAAATGKRLRDLPLTPARVTAVLAG